MTTSCQTWASSSHIRHPWFDTTIMKRKHGETVSADEELDTHVPTGARVTAKVPPPKRRRTYSNLENGFAHMSLGGWSATTSSALPSGSLVSSYPSVQELLPPNNLDMDADMRSSPIGPGPIQRLTYTVEEPTIPEVTMKTSSWYEPEPDRIVITDMDSFTQSDEEEEGEEADLRINPVLLGQIRTNGIDPCSSSRSRPPLSTSQALVLFKPLPFSETEIERVKEVQAKQKREAEDKQVERDSDSDSDAMDVEP